MPRPIGERRNRARLLHRGHHHEGGLQRLASPPWARPYSTPQRAGMIPTHIFYLMFWLPAHRRQLLGPAGRPDGPWLRARRHGRPHSSLTGEGLQHADGHSQHAAGVDPTRSRSHDPRRPPPHELGLHHRKAAWPGCSGENPENVFFASPSPTTIAVRSAPEPANSSTSSTCLAGMYQLPRGQLRRRQQRRPDPRPAADAGPAGGYATLAERLGRRRRCGR